MAEQDWGDRNAPESSLFPQVHPHRRPRLDPKVIRKQDSDYLTLVVVFFITSQFSAVCFNYYWSKAVNEKPSDPHSSGWVLGRNEPMKEKSPLLM